MTYKFRTQWSRWIAVIAATCLITVGVNIGSHRGLNASDIAENQLVAEDISAVWANGSFPVENFQSYTSPFGYRTSPVSGKRQFHNGLDLAAPRGSYIRSWWGGQISELSDDTACGTSVSVQSGEWQHVYCHLEGYVDVSRNGTFLLDREGGIQLSLGQEIPAGARIGRIGMTGRTTGPPFTLGTKAQRWLRRSRLGNQGDV